MLPERLTRISHICPAYQVAKTNMLLRHVKVLIIQGDNPLINIHLELILKHPKCH